MADGSIEAPGARRRPAPFAFLGWSARNGSTLLVLGIVAGLLVPPLARAFRWFIAPNVVCMMTLVLLRVDVPALVGHLRHPWRIVAVTGVQLLVCPPLVAAVVAVTPLDPGIAAGLVIYATGCAATSGAAFARLAGLDPELSLIGTLVTTALVPVTGPPLADWLAHVDLAITIGGFMARLGLVVGLPLCLSLVIRRAAGRARLEPLGPAVDGAMVWLVVGYGFGVMDGLAARAFAEPGWMAQATAAAFAINVGLNALTTAVFLPLGRRSAASAGLMSGNRNMAVYLAVIPAAADPRIVVFFAICQIPLFLSPFLWRPAFRRFVP